MPTQLQAWRRAWAHVDAEVRHGILTSDGTPTRKVRQTLFNTVFPELPTRLRSPRHQATIISDWEAESIGAATRAHAADLIDLTRISGFVKSWLTEVPELTEDSASVKNAADLWAPRVQKMIADAGGLALLVAAGESGWAAWLGLFDHIGVREAAGLPADARALRRHLRTPGVALLVEQEISDAWRGRPAESRTMPNRLEAIGLIPWEIPTGEVREAIDAGAEEIMAAWPHDELCRRLGLTRINQGSALPPPPVLRGNEVDDEPPASAADLDDLDEDANDDQTSRLEAPLDRSLLFRLVHRNRRAPQIDGRPITVRELVSEEIARCAAPLGLLGTVARRALVAAGASLAHPLWSEGATDQPRSTANHPDHYLLRIGAQLRSVLRAAYRNVPYELLPAETQRRLFEPADTFGPRLWSRLHNWERDRRRADPYSAVTSVWSSWLQDLTAAGHGVPPTFVSVDALPGAPGNDGAPLDPRIHLPPPPHFPGEAITYALRHLAETLGADVRAFVEDAFAGRARPQTWADLTARADALEPGIIDPWPTFDAALDYLNQL